MFSKKTPAEEDTMDWGTNDVMAPEAVPAAEAPAANNIYQPAAGCVISAGTVFTGNIEANDNVVLEGRSDPAVSRVAVTDTPEFAAAMNTPYAVKISWYSPTPALPIFPAMYTRKNMPAARSASPVTVSSAAFSR